MKRRKPFPTARRSGLAVAEIVLVWGLVFFLGAVCFVVGDG